MLASNDEAIELWDVAREQKGAKHRALWYSRETELMRSNPTKFHGEPQIY